MISALLKAHEKLIICVAVVFLCFHCYDKYDSRKVVEDQQVAHTATLTLQQQTEANDLVATQNLKLIVQLTAQVQQLQASNAALTAKESSDVATVKNETAAQVDSQLSKFSGQTIIPTLNGSSTINADAAKAIVEQLDRTVELQSELTNETQAVTDLQKIVSAQAVQIAGLQAEVKDETVACNAQINEIKTKHKKSILTVIKYVGGIAFGIGLYAGHAL